MTQEPDKDSPATQGDLDTLAGEMALRFDGVHAELAEMRHDMGEMRDDVDGLRDDIQQVRSDMAGLQRGLQAVLDVATSVENQLRELTTLPVRVERLERSRR